MESDIWTYIALFALEMGIIRNHRFSQFAAVFRYNNFTARSRNTELFHIFRPPEFCLGPKEEEVWTVQTWTRDQEAEIYQKMTIQWAELQRLFQSDPWGPEGAEGKKAKMAFMACYNTDQFREFVFGSSFLDRYKVKRDTLKKIQKDEVQLMRFGFEWVKLFLFGMKSKKIRPRRQGIHI